MAHVADDDRPVSKAELRAVVLADPDTLGKPEGGTQPLHRLAYVWVDEHGDDGGSRNRAVGLQHGSKLPQCGRAILRPAPKRPSGHSVDRWPREGAG